MKISLRKELLSKRNHISKENLEIKSKKIFENILHSNILDGKKNIMVYMDFRNEVKTENIINYLLKNNYNVILPKVNFQTGYLDLFYIDSLNDLTVSSYGILEPKVNKSSYANPENIDLIFVPGVGFDKNFFRIGYGGGYYDKLLPQTKNCIFCALAFEEQIVEKIPYDSHDVKMDIIITEKQIFKSKLPAQRVVCSAL